jgi:dienelactone hydrolase
LYNTINFLGFCWGAFSTLTLGAGNLVDAVAVAHPSRLDLPSDVENLKKPCLFLCAETDQQFDQEKQALSKEVLKNRMDEGHQFVFYSGTCSNCQLSM